VIGVIEQATERVVVGVSGSVANLAALHAAVESARGSAVSLVAVLAWIPVGGELAYRRAPCPPLLHVWHNAARERLCRAFDDAFGRFPNDVAIEARVIRGDAGPILTRFADQPGDLLIVGAGRGLPWLHGVSRYCLRHASCPVQAVEPPPMIRDLHDRRWVERELRHTMINPAG
jgi:nucleotide-binding universal stress UspA family protein